VERKGGGIIVSSRVTSGLYIKEGGGESKRSRIRGGVKRGRRITAAESCSGKRTSQRSAREGEGLQPIFEELLRIKRFRWGENSGGEV